MTRLISDHNCDPDTRIILGGDFNYTPNNEIDRQGGNPNNWEGSRIAFTNLLEEHDLVDIWRIRQPNIRRFTWWRGGTTTIFSRLDYFLISDCAQTIVESTDIVPVTFSDHSAVTLTLILGKVQFGPSFWKFNSSLLEDPNYIQQLNDLIDQWSLDFMSIENKSLFWDIIKYHIRKFTIKYSKEKSKERKAAIHELEENLITVDRLCSLDPSPENVEKLGQIRAQLDKCYDYITQGAIVRSRAQWVEKGEKNTKFFLGIEKRNRNRSNLQRVIGSDGNVIQDHKAFCQN